jgi:hypothetical protein
MENSENAPTNTPSANMGDEVKKAFINQFAENQNHYQRLFVQFLSAVLIALVAYAFVYTNTSNYVNPNRNEVAVKIQPSDSSSVLGSFEAETFDTIKDKDGHILSYGKIHLIAANLFAQLILLVLGLTLLNMGYAFRRDQHVIHNIRVSSLSEKEYTAVFEIGFTGLKKRIINYLPNFYGILFFAIMAMQLLVYLSIYFYLTRFETESLGGTEKEQYFLSFLGYGVSYRTVKFFLLFPLLTQFCFYVLYFLKYNSRVNNIKLRTQLTITSLANRANLRTLIIVCFAFFILKVAFLAFFFSLSLFASATLSFFAGWANSFYRYLSLKQDSAYQRKQNISNAIFYFLSASLILSVTTYGMYHQNLRISATDISPLISISFLLVISIYIVAELYQQKFRKSGSNAITIVDQLKFESYLFFTLFIGFFFIFFTKIRFIDYVVSFGIGLLSLAWFIRSVAFIIDDELERSKS